MTQKPYRAPVALKTNGLADPLGIDTPCPVLSWINPWEEAGARQTAVQVQTASSPEALALDQCLWKTPKSPSVPFNGDTSVRATGPSPRSRQRVYWRVRTWNEHDDATDWSEPAFFEMGLLDASDWKAEWVGLVGASNALFRCPFRLERPRRNVIRARLYVAGVGYYAPRLNGARVGDDARATEYTDYWKRVVYQTYDVGKALADGDNVLGIALGCGWFERFGYGHSQFRAQLEMDFSDGSHQLVGARSAAWRCFPGPCRESDPFHGETHDARLDPAGWDGPGFAERPPWGAVAAAHAPPPGQMVGLKARPVQVTETRRPVSVREVRPGVHVVDFGQNFAGWVRLRSRGTAGTMVQMRFAELLNEDGTVNQGNLRSARATDRYVMSGAGEELWEPSFTYHGFRFVQVEGFPDLPPEWSLTGCVAHTPMERRGTFSCSDPRLTRLHENADWTLRANTYSVFTDCPQRDERQGWLGDGHLVCETMLHHFDAGPFYHKWLDDIRDTQGPEHGNRPSPVAPPWYLAGRASEARPPAPEQADTVWTSAGTLIPWYLLLYHGDRAIVQEHFDAIERHLGYLAANPEYPFVTANQFGDWLFDGWGLAKDPADPVLLATAFFIEQLNVGIRMADLLNRHQPRTRFERWRREAVHAVRERFLDLRSGTFGGQTADALALQFGFAPETERGRIVDHMVVDLERRGWHLATGIVGTKYLLEALSQNGRFDAAWRAVTAEGYPGWMEMLKNGATTITERWNYTGNLEMNSHCHPVLGVVSGWMYRWLAGIRADPEAPGYRRFTVAPEIPEGLDWVRASLQTVRGPLSVEWKRAGASIELALTAPPSSEATVLLPGRAAERVGAGRHTFNWVAD